MPEEPDIVQWISTVALQQDTITIIMSVSRIEDWLQSVLKSAMIDLSSKLEDRLFRGYGPLNTFSGKIDIAYALSMFDQTTYNDLRALKDIRNAFAHARDMLHFSSPELTPLFQKLSGWSVAADPATLFTERVHACVDTLKVPLDKRALIEALLSSSSKKSD